jgi:hypothetical protein
MERKGRQLRQTNTLTGGWSVTVSAPIQSSTWNRNALIGQKNSLSNAPPGPHAPYPQMQWRNPVDKCEISWSINLFAGWSFFEQPFLVVAWAGREPLLKIGRASAAVSACL